MGLRSLFGRTYGFAALLAMLAVGLLHDHLPANVSGDLVALAPFRQEVAVRAERPFPICGQGARVDCIVDGDTFYFSGEKIRIADIDTPEIFSPRCRAEKALGERATHRLHQLLNAGPIELRGGGRNRDAYGRLLRTVWRDGRSLGDILVSEGLAHRWAGYKQSWCG